MMPAFLQDMISADLTGLILGLGLRSLVILGAAALFAFLARRSSSSVRHLIWSAATAALLVMPLLSIALPKWAPEIPVPAVMSRSESAPAAQPAPHIEGGSSSFRGAAPPISSFFIGSGSSTASTGSAAPSEPAGLPDALPGRTQNAGSRLPVFWWFGFTLVMLLMVAEVVRLRLIARNALPLVNDERVDLAERISRSLGLTRCPRVLEGETSVMPMTWGFRSPVVLLPAASRTWSTARLTSVLSHELAHVRRGDYAVQLVAEFVTALYWFNPLAWYAAHRLKVERELACDDEVVAGGTAAFDYADDLLDLARTMRTRRMTSRAALSMARSSQLAGRLSAILDERRARGGFSHRGAALVAAVALLLSAGIASVSPAMVARRAPSPPPRAVLAPAFPALPAFPPLPSVAPTAPEGHFFAQNFTDDENVEGRWKAERDRDQVQFELRFRSGTSSWTHSFSIPSREFAAISQRTHNGFEIRRDAGTFLCRGEFEVSKSGARGSGPVTFKGNPDYITEMKRRGYRVDEGDLMQFASHDVSYEFMKAMSESGYDDLTLDRLLEFRIHGVSAEYVRAMHVAGLGDIPSERIMEMRIHGVTPEFVTAMRRMGLDSYEPDDFIQMRIHGVTPEFAEAVGRLGLTDLSIDDLLQMRIHGVTPEFIRGFRDAGLKDVPVDRLVELRIHGVTPEFIRKVHRDGYKDATIDEIIEMKIMGRSARRGHR